MKHPLSITVRGFEPTDALKKAVETCADKLETFYVKIESRRAVVEAPHRHHHEGNVYYVRVRLTVPGEEIVVARDRSVVESMPGYYLAVFCQARAMGLESVSRARKTSTRAKRLEENAQCCELGSSEATFHRTGTRFDTVRDFLLRTIP